LEVLRESHDADIEWVVASLDYGSVAAAVRAVPLNDDAVPQVPVLCRDYFDAVTLVQQGRADTTLLLHQRMYRLAQLADEAHPLAIAANSQKVHLRELVPQQGFDSSNDYVTYGTLRGRVETLSRHLKLSFRLYELATDAAVICHMAPDTEETMRNVWGHLADVTGTISRDPNTDKPRSMKSITSVEPVVEGTRGGWRRARGALRSETPAEVLIRCLRDDG